MASFFHKLLNLRIVQGLSDTHDYRVSNPVSRQLCYTELLETSMPNKAAGSGCGKPGSLSPALPTGLVNKETL